MKLRDLLSHAILFLSCHTLYASAARKPANSVLLSSIKSLTLKDGKDTTARRTSAVPQLTCIGGNAHGLYNVDVMRCTNSGSDYDEDNIQWTCKASLPPEFKLGATDVICEGYDSPEDPYILKGSCGVEYRLVLTDAGERKYGQREDIGDGQRSTWSEQLGFGICLLFIVGVVAYGIWSSCAGGGGGQRQPRAGGGRGWGGGWGDDDDGNDPPPPYTRQAPPKSSQTPGTQGWRPGLGTAASVAAGAAAAGYYMGNNRNSTRGADPMVGSSRAAAQRNNSGGLGSGSNAAPSSSRYESTGFGETRRR